MDSQLKARFIMLYQMILADGIVDVAELEVYYRIGKEKYGLTSEQISSFTNLSLRESGLNYPLPTTLEGKVTLLYQLAEIALADGKIEKSEKKLIKKYAKLMGFEDENIDDIVEFMFNQVKQGIPEDDVLKMLQ